MDTSDLKGAHLDYWVACAERQNSYVDAGAIPMPPPPFSSDPVLGEAIIEREQIALFLVVDAEFGNQFLAGAGPAKYRIPIND
ncbi:hypothetical protein [Paraburkholderia saeva]|uniref:hypothetical protein n=1 Tax=Paraburkholderia saeva TaxID=2777537 RepID=UPI001E0EC32F|nr:hypothetical protein [Paraburkholderia saeva]CAG4895495.1 hypothetical protein R52603_01996 [Paraburkholderia saeva]